MSRWCSYNKYSKMANYKQLWGLITLSHCRHRIFACPALMLSIFCIQISVLYCTVSLSLRYFTKQMLSICVYKIVYCTVQLFCNNSDVEVLYKQKFLSVYTIQWIVHYFWHFQFTIHGLGTKETPSFYFSLSLVMFRKIKH